MSTRTVLASLSVLALTAACTQANRPSTEVASVPSYADARCTAWAPGTRVLSSDTRDGGALTFMNADPVRMQTLRSQVHAFTERHNRGAGTADARGGGPGSDMSGHRDDVLMTLPPTTQILDLPNAVQLIWAVPDGRAADALRTTIRTQAQQIGAGEICPVMRGRS